MAKKRRGTRPYVRSAPNPKLTPETCREVIHRIRRGDKKTAVAQALGISRMGVYRVLKEYAPELIKR